MTTLLHTAPPHERIYVSLDLKLRVLERKFERRLDMTRAQFNAEKAQIEADAAEQLRQLRAGGLSGQEWSR